MGAPVTLMTPDPVTGVDKLLGSSASPFLTQVTPGTTTDRSFAVTNVAQNAMAANTARKGWKIKNDTTEPVWIRFTGNAAAVAGSGSMRIAAGGYMESQGLPAVETGAMSIIHGATVIGVGATAPVTIYEFT